MLIVVLVTIGWHLDFVEQIGILEKNEMFGEVIDSTLKFFFSFEAQGTPLLPYKLKESCSAEGGGA